MGKCLLGMLQLQLLEAYHFLRARAATVDFTGAAPI
jgi:hypothetical protein